MFLTEISNHGNIPVLERTLSYAEARHAVLAANVANIDTPGYKARYLDPAAFQGALRRAIDERQDDARKPLDIPNHEQFRIDDHGHLRVSPVEEPYENVLFHDRTNPRIEELMADLAENFMTYNLASQMLSNAFDGLKTAIRGVV